MGMQLFANNAESVLANGISASATTLNLQAGDGNVKNFPSPSGGNFFLLTLCQRIGAVEANWEIVKVTARNGDVLTIERAQEGTTAQVHNAGEMASCRLTAGSLGTDSIAEGVSNKYFTESRVLNAVMAGVSFLVGSAVVASDTLLSAIGKLQKQLSDVNIALGGKLGTSGGTMSGVLTVLVTRGTKVVMGGGNAIDLTMGEYFSKTVSGSTSLSVINAATNGAVSAFILNITDGGSAAISWWNGIKWAGGVVPALTVSGRDRLGFITEDGTSWDGFLLAKDIK